jgi:hypothetical protein
MATKKPDAAPASTSVRLMVRAVSAQGDRQRYRAGLGPFGRDPVMVDATPEQADALRADPMLEVGEAAG